MSLYIYAEDTGLLWPNLIKKKNQCWCFSLPGFTASYSAAWVNFLSKSHVHLSLTSCSGSLCWALGIFRNIRLSLPQHVIGLYTSTHKVKCGCGPGLTMEIWVTVACHFEVDGCRASVGLTILSGETDWQCLRCGCSICLGCQVTVMSSALFSQWWACDRSKKSIPVILNHWDFKVFHVNSAYHYATCHAAAWLSELSPQLDTEQLEARTISSSGH